VPDDLSSIGGLADKYVRALNRRHVTGLRELAQLDPEAMYWAMAILRPRPTREQVAHWQDDARCQLGQTAADPAEWRTAASFVVVFSQRLTGGIWERRIEAERTEVEPERATEVWSGWNAAPVCAWMTGQLGRAEGDDPPAPMPRPASARMARTQLRIDSAALIDAIRAWLRGGAGRAGPRVRDGLRSGRAP